VTVQIEISSRSQRFDSGATDSSEGTATSAAPGIRESRQEAPDQPLRRPPRRLFFPSARRLAGGGASEALGQFSPQLLDFIGRWDQAKIRL
jgi:hypothetical protein